MSAHTKIANIVKEDDAAMVLRLECWYQVSPDHDFGSSGFVHDGSTKAVVLGSQAFKPFRPCATREFRPPVDNGTRRLSTSMGVDDAKRLDFVGDCHAGMVALRDGREQLDLVPFRRSAT
jgi:hypothetical protein